jgi:hypothetical protein
MTNEKDIVERITQIQEEEIEPCKTEEMEEEPEYKEDEWCGINGAEENNLPYEIYESQKENEDAIKNFVCGECIDESIEALIGQINKEAYKQILEHIKDRNYTEAWKVINFLNDPNWPA